MIRLGMHDITQQHAVLNISFGIYSEVMEGEGRAPILNYFVPCDA